ncbi:flavodoxin family protein [Methyloprofundus sp.]|uniref:flavodoxin family protein n=1 Tax=Methyloprofundus sp. TaxID=2020875 RepID=UPI003D131578
MTKVLAINSSYRDEGFTDQTVDALTRVLESRGAEVETILLREYPIEFCLNCRECTQQASELPGTYAQHDGMQALIDKIENKPMLIFSPRPPILDP